MVIIPFVFMPGAPRKGSIQHALAPETRHFYLAETRHFNFGPTCCLCEIRFYVNRGHGSGGVNDAD
jgi:hypothetical protein